MQNNIWIPLITIFLLGCSHDRPPKTLGENEYYIGERLASLSADPDSTFWIGGESDMVWHVDGNKVTQYITGTDRIYKIATRPNNSGDTTCWLGGRNSGLQVWNLRRGKMTHDQTYSILSKGKQYSAYDFSFTDNGIYTATSQGLYLLDCNQQFSLLYPDIDSPTATSGVPFVVYNLCPYKQRYLFASSIDGLLRVDLRNNTIRRFHEGENVRYVSVYGDEVCSLSGKRIYVEDVGCNAITQVDLDFTPRFYYRVGKIHYILRSHSMVISDDLKHFITIPLRRDFPRECQHVMLPDYRSESSIFITTNAFWRIPFHSSYFNNKGIVTSACSNSKEAYYLNSQNELFRQYVDDSVAVKVFSLPKGEQITEMAVTDSRRLVYVNDRSELRSVDISGSNLRNELLSRIKTLYRSQKKVTALHLKGEGQNTRIYIGVQDGLVVIDGDGRARPEKEMDDKYITSFFSLPNSSGTYMSTMDAGVLFENNGRYTTIPSSEGLTYIRDLFVSNEYHPSLTVLTSHALVRPVQQDTLTLNGYNRLIAVNDSLFYAFPEFGVEKYAIKNGQMKRQGIYFRDILFNPKASFQNKHTLYLVSEIGVMKIKPGAEDSPQYVEFDITVTTAAQFLAVIATGFLLLALILSIYSHRKSEKKRRTLLRIKDLKDHTAGMERVIMLFDQKEQDHIRTLIEKVHSLNAGDKEVNEQISRLSAQIMDKNGDLALLQSKMLERQIEELRGLNAYDCVQLAHESTSVLSRDKVSEIREKLIENDLWLSQYKKLLEDMKRYNAALDGCITVEAVNGPLIQHLEILENMIHHRPIADIQAQLQQAERDYAHIFTPDSLHILTETLHQFKRRAEQLPTDEVGTALLEIIDKSTADAPMLTRIELLRTMKYVEALLLQSEIRIQMRREMDSYRVVRENTIRKNKTRGVKKTGLKLDAEIAADTQSIVERINELIDRLYDAFAYTDQDVLDQVLNFTNFTGQQARVLALLIANPKEKRVLLPGMLGMYGNLNPVISRLVNHKLKNYEGWLQAYVSKYPASIAFYIMKLLE